MVALKDWSAILGPLATCVIGLAVAYVAWQQWQVARNKLRLELFDRRYRVFEAARTFLLEIQSKPNFNNSQLFAFNAGVSDRELLFEPDVVAYLQEIKERALEMRGHQYSLETIPPGESRTLKVKEENDELLWLTEQISAMTKYFAPYLGLSHIQ